ncbi:MAG: fused MFS/spermidine synthase [Roseivivax sp.]|nr:fused MFS/spermidine synthase [Roseivivax sp.]
MPRQAPLWVLVLVQAVTSAASLVVEIVAGRMLAPYVGMSLYTWTAVIAVVLAGFSLGHWWGGRLAARPLRRALVGAAMALALAAITTAGAVGALFLAAKPVLELVPHPVGGIVLLCLVAFFLPSLFVGVPAPVLAQAAIASAPEGRTGPALGAMFAAGAVGAIAGTLLAGFVFISWLGSAATLVTVAAVYLGAAAACLGLAGVSRHVPTISLAMLALGTAGSAVLLPRSCDVESRYFCLRTVDVSARSDSPVNMMVIDHLTHGISARDLPQVMFTDHAAMLDGLARLRATRADFSSFFIGGGSYSVPRAFAHAGSGPVTVAEIDPAVTAVAMRDFWLDPAMATVLHEDARRALLTRPEAVYDVIVGDAFSDVAVPQHLVTREFFALVAARLRPGGSFLMTVIDYEDRLYALASVVATLRAVFPEVEVWTEARRPEPGERLVFVVVAGSASTRQGNITLPSPDQTRFAVLGPLFIDGLAARRGMILTDDFAPIDRLVGQRD